MKKEKLIKTFRKPGDVLKNKAWLFGWKTKKCGAAQNLCTVLKHIDPFSVFI